MMSSSRNNAMVGCHDNQYDNDVMISAAYMRLLSLALLKVWSPTNQPTIVSGYSSHGCHVERQ